MWNLQVKGGLIPITYLSDVMVELAITFQYSAELTLADLFGPCWKRLIDVCRTGQTRPCWKLRRCWGESVYFKIPCRHETGNGAERPLLNSAQTLPS